MSNEAYKVAITIALKNEVSGVLQTLLRDFSRLDDKAKALTKSLGGIGKNTTAGLESVSRSMSQMEKKAESLAKKLEKIGKRGKGGAAAAEKGEDEPHSLAGHLAGIGEKTEAGRKVIDAGKTMMEALKGPLDEADKFEQAFAKFKLMGLGGAANEEAEKFARSMNVMGSSYTDNMQAMTQAVGVFRAAGATDGEALAQAKMAAPTIAKLHLATSTYDDETRENIQSQDADMLRFIKARGGMKDAKSFNDIADTGWKAMQASGGTLKWSQLNDVLASGGAATANLSDKALMGEIQPLLNHMSGGAIGDGIAGALSHLTSTSGVSADTAHMLADAGVWDAKKIKWNKKGGVDSVGGDGNPLKDLAAFNASPTAFYEKYIAPMYDKQHLDAGARAVQNTRLFGDKGGALFTAIDGDKSAIHASASNLDKASTLGKSADAARDSSSAQFKDLQANLQDVMIETGNAVLPMMVDGLRTINPMLKDLAGWMHEHTGTVKVLTFAFAGLGAALILGGTINTAATGLRAISAALEFTGAGGAGGLSRLASGIGSVGSGLASMGKTVVSGLASVSRAVIANVGGASGALGLLGRTSLVAAAAFAGWQLGTWLYDTYLQGTKFSDWLGGLLTHVLAFFGNSDAKEALEIQEKAKKAMAQGGQHIAAGAKAQAAAAQAGRAQQYAPLPSRASAPQQDAGAHEAPGQSPVNVVVNNYLDGKEIASHFVPNFSTGTTDFNSGASALRPGMGNMGIP